MSTAMAEPSRLPRTCVCMCVTMCVLHQVMLYGKIRDELNF